MTGNLSVKIKLLWHNPTPTLAFVNQEIMIPVTNYDLLLITAIYAANNSINQLFTQVFPVVINSTNRLWRLEVVQGDNKCYWSQRDFDIKFDRLFFKENIESNLNLIYQVQNYGDVPLYIYGIKNTN